MVLLFFALTPGILLYLPSGSSKKVVALTHGVVFTAVWWLTHKYVWKMSLKMEGMTSPTHTKKMSEGMNAKKPTPTY
jgi:hypothetical protein